ncbi:MAG: ATP-dependent DNA helicase RecG [Burkholderiales bacterium]|nr:ATP-dependent DNA helicase RecG [Burkholderiales bacterium]
MCLTYLSLIQNVEKYQSKLDKLDIHNYWDLACHIPLRYEDLTKTYKIRDAVIGQTAMIEGTIIGHEIQQKRSKQLLVRLDDGSSIITLLFFHFFPNYATQYKVGKIIRAFGEIKGDRFGNKTIFHPKIQTAAADNKLSNTFSPIYPSTNGLNNATLITLVEQLFEQDILQETLPQSIIDSYNLMRLPEAFLMLHKLTPEQLKNNLQEKALYRLKFDELLSQQLLMQNIYKDKHKNQAPSIKSTHKLIIPLMQNLPFKLTNAQNKVLHEILADMALPHQMNRLLQGDVGSGKTIVATICALATIENGYQAAIMAPTEILAEQHYLKISQLTESLGIKVVWLSGSLTAKQKREAIEKCQNNDAQLIVGTHAIFQKNVEFHNLGMVIIDEQHRFGVEQRMALINKGNQDSQPHQLMMSATPIPRSLAMSYYADLDVSSIDELPPGRTPIETILINTNRRNEVIQFIREHVELNHQVYWVCPLIEESEKLELENAINTHVELCNTLKPIEIGLVHGKMKPKEKAQVMSDFIANKTQVLVATTVIEVGVDVPNASIIVIEHSERMGLAQLHQLRGRVGRGSIESQCILLFSNNLSEVAKERLKVISSTTDGFEIARQDLLIRGPGELLGARQSGLPLLKFANLETDLKILETAKEAAKTLAKSYPKNAEQLIKIWLYNKQIYANV